MTMPTEAVPTVEEIQRIRSFECTMRGSHTWEVIEEVSIGAVMVLCSHCGTDSGLVRAKPSAPSAMKVAGRPLDTDDYPSYAWRMVDFVDRSFRSQRLSPVDFDDVQPDWEGITVVLTDGRIFRGNAVGVYVRDHIDSNIPMEFQEVLA